MTQFPPIHSLNLRFSAQQQKAMINLSEFPNLSLHPLRRKLHEWRTLKDSIKFQLDLSSIKKNPFFLSFRFCHRKEEYFFSFFLYVFLLFKKSPDNIISTTPFDDIIKAHKKRHKKNREKEWVSERERENCMQPIQFYVPINNMKNKEKDWGRFWAAHR